MCRSMARPLTSDGDIEDLGSLIRAAYGLDRSWVSRATCRDYPISQRRDGKTPWHIDWGDRIDGVHGKKIVEMALMICFGCEAQYDCARYAIAGKMAAGTWSMPFSDLEELQKMEDGGAVIDEAEARGVPVQVHVRGVLDNRTADLIGSAS